MDQIWAKISELAEANNGFFRTAQVEKIGISRPMLRKYTDAGKLEQVRKGLYVITESIPDEFALLQEQCRAAIFSYGTALYLWGLSDRTPHLYDITVPRGQNITILKRDNPNLRSHYLPREFYEIGITQTHSPQGAEVSQGEVAIGIGGAVSGKCGLVDALPIHIGGIGGNHGIPEGQGIRVLGPACKQGGTFVETDQRTEAARKREKSWWSPGIGKHIKPMACNFMRSFWSVSCQPEPRPLSSIWPPG